MQPVSRNPFAPGGHFWRQISTRPASGSLRQRTGTFRLPPATPAAHGPASRRTGRPRRPDIPPPPQTGGSVPFRPHIPPRTDRRFRSMQAAQFRPAQTGYSTRCRQAMLRTADRSHARVRAQKKRDGSPLSTQGAGTKKTGRQPTLGPARGTGYRDASSCRRPAICGKISAQITRRTGTARQPGQPVVQI